MLLSDAFKRCESDAKAAPRHLALRRREWLSLPDTEARVSQLEALLLEHVPLRRQPVLQDRLVFFLHLLYAPLLLLI